MPIKRRVLAPPFALPERDGAGRFLPAEIRLCEKKKIADDRDGLFSIIPIAPTDKNWLLKTKRLWRFALPNTAPPKWLRPPQKHAPRNYDLTLWFSDTHLPHCDERVVAAILHYFYEAQPDVVGHTGDLSDMNEISRFDKTLIEESRLLPNMRQARALICLLKTLCWWALFFFTEGNHEDRWGKLFRSDKFRVLKDVMGQHLSLQKMLCMDEAGNDIIGMSWYEYGDYYTDGSFIWTHSGGLSKHSAYSEKMAADKYGVSGAQGHSHRCGAFYWTGITGEHKFIGIGCTCGKNPSYVKHPNWQHGFGMHERRHGSKRFDAREVKVTNGAFMINGKKYGD